MSLHVGRGLYDQLIVSRAPKRCETLVKCLQPCLLRAAVFVLIRMLFKTGRGGAQLCSQDRMDNVRPPSSFVDTPRAPRSETRVSRAHSAAGWQVRKAASIKGDVFAIFAEHDEMMHPDIAYRLVQARYGHKASPELLRSRVLCVPGGHCCFFGEVPELAHKYATYLKSSGFLLG